MWDVNEEFLRRALFHHTDERGVIKFYWKDDEPVGRITSVTKWQKVRFRGCWVVHCDEDASALHGGFMHTNSVIVKGVQFYKLMEAIAEEKCVQWGCLFFLFVS